MIFRSRIFPLFITLLTVLTCTANAAANDAVEKYTFHVGNFSTLRIQDNVNVIYHCSNDTTGLVTYRGTSEFDDAFILTNNRGNLKIQVNTEDVGKADLPVLHVYSDNLVKVENYSDFHLEVEGAVNCDKFVARLMGNGTIDLENIHTKDLNASVTAGNGKIYIKGSAEKANFRMTGTGTIQATDLTAESVKIRIFGGGCINCSPARLLDVRGLGSTTVSYTGSPRIIHKGGGKLIPITP